jgi:hypothetical protein
MANLNQLYSRDQLRHLIMLLKTANIFFYSEVINQIYHLCLFCLTDYLVTSMKTSMLSGVRLK